MATEKAHEVSASNLRHEAVLKLIRRLAKERDPNTLIETFCEETREIVGAHFTAAWLLDAAGLGLSGFVAKGMDAPRAALFSAATPIAEFVRERLELTPSLRMKNLGSQCAAAGGVATVNSIRLRSALCVRIDSSARRHGYLVWLNKIGTDEFCAEDEQMALALAALVGVCYEAACRPFEAASQERVLKQEAVERDRNENRLRESEERFRQLSNRLLQLQDEERRRVARELHDSTSQALALAAMNLDFLLQKDSRFDAANGEAERLLSDCRALIEQCTNEIRTTSYVLHPPLLEEIGLAGAIGDFAQGFARRSGIHATVEAPPDFGRLPRDVEVALFRVIQESLVNIHKHSGSKIAAIRLARSAEHAVLEIEDLGRGLPPGLLQDDSASRLGVGILGMRERLKQLRGQLEIVSSSTGVLVRAAVPLE